MIEPALPVDELERQAAVQSLDLLDSPVEERFDRFTRLAQNVFDVPIALISLVDGERVWFKSHQGMAETEAPRDVSFCGHTILQDGFLHVPDARKDPRFAESPLVTDEPHVRFYVGATLTSSDGYPVVTLCLIDTVPREFSKKNLAALRDIADATEAEIQRAGEAAIYAAANASRFLMNENFKRVEEYEARFHDLTAGSLQGLMITNGERIEFANSALAELFGYRVDEMLALNSWVELIAPEDRSVVLGYCHNRADKKEAPAQYEYRGLRKDGSILWLENLSTNVVWNGTPCVQAAVVDISARKHIEQELQEGEARFRHFAEASSDWFWEMDEELRYTWFSERVEEFTNFPREWHYGKTREELGIPDDQREEWIEHLELLKARKPYRDFIYRREAPDGVRWVRSSGVPIFGPQGDFQGYRGTGNDITQEMEIRDAATQANTLLKSAVDGLNETFSLWGPDDNLLVFNEQFREHNRQIADYIKPGISFTEFTCIALQNGIYAEAEGCEEEWYQERLQMHRNPIGQFEQERGDGTWLLIHEQKIGDGSTITISMDITARKMAALAQQESESRFQDFARSSADRFWEMDRDLRFTSFIDMSREPDEADRRRVQGKTRWVSVGADPESDLKWKAHRADLLARRSFRDFDYLVIDERGGEKRWRISGVPLFDTNEVFQGYRGVGTDVTAIKQTEEQRDLAIRQAAEASRAKSVFLANMSHELRTPLNAIIGFSDVMHQGVFGELGHPKYSEYVEDISRSAQHLLLLINDVLDISKIEAEKLDITEAEIEIGMVMDMCASMLEPQSKAKSLSLSVTHPSPSVRLLGDDSKLRQIIINLLANAVKFTPKRGSIHLMAECAPAGNIILKVSDSGIGIPAEDIERVQQPFELGGNNSAGSQEGTGLGLAITKRFIELHGGELKIESELDKGTTVSVIFTPERTIPLT